MKRYSCPFSLTAAFLNMWTNHWDVVHFAWLQNQYHEKGIPCVFTEEEWYDLFGSGQFS